MPAKKNGIPHNKGKSQGQKKHFTPQQIGAIHHNLSVGAEENLKELRDLALFCTGIDTMLRASDLLKLKVDDVQNPDSSVKDSLPIKQRKTGEPQRVAFTERTKEVLVLWIEKGNKFFGDNLFTGWMRGREQELEPITISQYRRIVKDWARIAGVKDVGEYSTHSLRRTKAVELYQRTRNPELIRQVLGQTSVAATSHYLGLDKKQALDIAKTVKLF